MSLFRNKADRYKQNTNK